MWDAFWSEFEELEAKVMVLEPPAPDDRAGILRDQAALVVDGLLNAVATRHGALDVAIGEALHLMNEGDRALQLGFSGIADYACERLGVAARTAGDMTRLSRALTTRPLLSAAVHSGEVSTRKAQTVLSVAQGESEAEWVERARVLTVRALQAAVRARRTRNEERGRSHVEVVLSREQRDTVDRAFSLARKVIGGRAYEGELLQGICEQYVADHRMELASGKRARLLRFPLKPLPDEWLEHETAYWEALEKRVGVPAPPIPMDVNVFELDEHFRVLAGLRSRWGGLVGRAALLVKMLGLWRDMGFRSFGAYCTERLQMSVRAVEQRIALERKLWDLPTLRTALERGRVTYEKARIIAAHATFRTVDAWIERGEKMTCVELKRAVDAEKGDAQMCRSSSLCVNVPDPAADLLEQACAVVEAVEGRQLSPGDCLERMARHFIGTWEPVFEPRRKPRFWRILERDGGRCRVPGCSRAARHVHHIQEKRHGGGDEEENLVSLCAVHHLRALHKGGYISVVREGSDRLRWELGVRRDQPPLLVFSRAA